MNSTLFGGQKWVPHVHEFKSQTLKDLFAPFFPRFSDERSVINACYENTSSLCEQSSSCIEDGVTNGDAWAQYKMFSVNLKLGNFEEAKKYLFSSAAQGNLDALLTLSEAYQGFWNIGIPKDVGVAKLLCQEASELGSDEARFRIEVAPFTEGFFECKRNFQQGIIKAKELADAKNQRAKEFIDAIMESSREGLQEGDDNITFDDLVFLKGYLGWKDTEEE